MECFEYFLVVRACNFKVTLANQARFNGLTLTGAELLN